MAERVRIKMWFPSPEGTEYAPGATVNVAGTPVKLNGEVVGEMLEVLEVRPDGLRVLAEVDRGLFAGGGLSYSSYLSIGETPRSSPGPDVPK